MSKIGNPVKEVEKGIELNEKDYCMCLLSTLKEMEKNMVVAMTEASNEWLFERYQGIFQSLSDYQRRVYTLMFQNGWYQLEAVETKKINDKYNMLDTEYKELSD